ncbi:hypothetical protein [Caulobacter sp. UNC279MFTsu5.1]|uniref:hypothetical protein n=1 Tax=Caulobacter sp. UNC279MFTsu5.1 TaxID=1502775 RepID=UPI0008F42DC3|nr:hypothetical protein [Caulobacter sp. UNC279MFTsu5.1]SFK41487.1 hypothetical protein SAMN02799626_04229 [Caulobacter sp. UNC279MFTsu5.1]
MFVYPEAAQAALDDGTALAVGAVKLVLTTGPWCVWGGHGPQILDGDTYVGIGDRGLVSVAAGQLGGAEQGATLSLSGVDPDALALVDTLTVRGAAAVLWELLFNQTGSTLLSARVVQRGRVDRLTLEDQIGGASTVAAAIEGAVRGLSRSSGRMRTDADQRLVVGADGGFKAVSYAGEITLNWGGKPPQRAASALPNALVSAFYQNTGLSGHVE